MPSVPSYRLHRATGQAVVTLSGRDHYLGKHGTQASRNRYDELVARWMASGRRPLDSRGATVADLVTAYREWALGYYVKDGRPTSQIDVLKRPLDGLASLYGSEPAGSFSPGMLRTLRDSWVADGLSRGTVNRLTSLVAAVFRWAVEREMVPAATWQALKAVAGLRRGRTTAPDHPPVGPADPKHVDAILTHLAPMYRAMVELQLHTGMRPGEVRTLRAEDVGIAPDVWIYRPRSHKTQHHGRARVVYLGPQSQAILGPWLNAARGLWIFPSPRTGKALDRKSYCDAVRLACRKAGVPEWHPNQLRHTFATLIRRHEGLDAAHVLLGHSRADTTQIYAEADADKARAAALKWG